MRLLLSRLSPIVLGVVLGLMVLAPMALGTEPSDQVVACGGKGNKVVAEFELERARDIWQSLPAMLQTPELETDERPAHVVVFEDGFRTRDLAFAGPAEKPAKLDGVICVIQADGVMNIYSDVSRAGSAWAP